MGRLVVRLVPLGEEAPGACSLSLSLPGEDPERRFQLNVGVGGGGPESVGTWILVFRPPER